MKKLLVLTLVLAMIFGCIACTAKPAATNDVKEIVIGEYSDVANVAAWMIRTGGDKSDWVYTIYEPLFTMSPEGNVIPYLAESLDTDADNMTYTVNLRDDVYFSDGSKLDADALLWNFENFKENGLTASMHFGTVDHFEKVSDKAVKIVMETWSSQIPYSLCSAAGLMYSKKAFA